LTRVKAATYDGISSWLDYKSQFDACSRINQWSENEKGLYLAVALIASFKFWGRDCLMRILISESARASIKCYFASASRTFSGTVGKAYLNLVRQLDD
jgi:hypothetical protein